MTTRAQQHTSPNRNLIRSSENLILFNELPSEGGLIDIIDFRGLSQDKNKITNVVFSDMGEAFVSVDTAGHIVVFYIARDKFINVCREENLTALFLTEKNNGMLILGMPDCSIQVYNLGKILSKSPRGKRI